MSNRFLHIILVSFVFAVTLFSCREKNYNGEDMINYPDLEMLLAKQVDMEEPLTYDHEHLEGDNVDSALLTYHQMPFDKLKDLFKRANLHRKELNFKYSIRIMNDTLANTRTLYYEALAPDIPTRSVSIVSDNFDNKVQSIYLVFNDKGFIQSKNYRVFILPKRLIQIQERTKENTIVDNYYYPEVL